MVPPRLLDGCWRIVYDEHCCRSRVARGHPPSGGPDHDAGTDTEPRVVVDPGEDLALRAVVKKDSANDVHLPYLHRPATFPAFVGRDLLAPVLGFDQVVPQERPIDPREGWNVA